MAVHMNGLMAKVCKTFPMCTPWFFVRRTKNQGEGHTHTVACVLCRRTRTSEKKRNLPWGKMYVFGAKNKNCTGAIFVQLIDMEGNFHKNALIV